MGYKMKPVKGVSKRFKITKNGKVKCHHALHSHLMSSRSPERRRRSRGSHIMDETIARSMRKLVNCTHLNPNRVRHEKEVAAKQAAKAAAN